MNRVSRECRKILTDTHIEIKSLSVTFGCEECDSRLAFSEGGIELSDDRKRARGKLTKIKSILVG